MKDSHLRTAMQGKNDKSRRKCFHLSCPTRFRQNGRFMRTSFSPTRQDVERYRSLRALSTDMTSVMMDCCLYDWFENGKNLVQRYAETHPAKPGTDESYLLQACLQAKYRILVAHSAVPGAGFHCQDVLNGGELFLMDLALSQSVPSVDVALATRTIPLGEYWMTGGAGLPVSSKKSILDALRRVDSEHDQPLEGPGGVALSIARACLAAGAADYVTYESPEANSRKPRRQPRWPGFKRRRR